MEPTLIAAASVASLSAPAVAWWHHTRWVAYYRRKGLPLPGRAVDAWSAEAADLVQLGRWYVTAWLADGLRVPPDREGPAVVCVHGYTQSGSNFWGIRRALEARRRATVAVSLLHRLAPPAWYADRLERRLDALVADEPRIDVVCHSMGGVVLRAVLARRADLRDRVGHVVTLGSPHAGTAAARGIPWLPEVQALKRRSRWLAALPPLVELAPRVTTVAGTLDTIVYPTDSALEPGADHVVLPVGHAGLLTRRAAIDAVVDALVGPAARPAPTVAR